MRSPSPVSTTSEIFKVRQYITNDACKILVQALGTSRLDYGNAVLQGLPQVLIERF